MWGRRRKRSPYKGNRSSNMIDCKSLDGNCNVSTVWKWVRNVNIRRNRNKNGIKEEEGNMKGKEDLANARAIFEERLAYARATKRSKKG